MNTELDRLRRLLDQFDELEQRVGSLHDKTRRVLSDFELALSQCHGTQPLPPVRRVPAGEPAEA